MTYIWLDWLASALRAEGCTVVEESGWKSRGRPSSTGSFNPYGVLWHHTGTTASYSNPFPTKSVLINGRSDLPGPLCQVGIGYDGVCHIIAAGRANHAGTCNGFGPFSYDDGNWQMVGFEIDYNGTQPMSPEQKDAAARASVAVLKKFGRNENYVATHKETSTTGKWDPGGVSGDQARSMTKKQFQADSQPPEDPDMNDFIQASSPEPVNVPDGEWVKINWPNVQAGENFLPPGWAQLKIGKRRFVITLSAQVTPKNADTDVIRTRFVELEDNNGDWDPGKVTETYLATEHKVTEGGTYLTDTRVQLVPEGRRLRAEINVGNGGATLDQARLTVLCFQP